MNRDFPDPAGDLSRHDLLNAQTGRIAWNELARYFARGQLVCVSEGQDLVAIAETLVRNDTAAVSSLYERGQLRRALDEDALRWHENNTEFWAVVVAPWVVVQECMADDGPGDNG